MNENSVITNLSQALASLPEPLSGPVFTEADGNVLSLSKLGLRAGLAFCYPGCLVVPGILSVSLQILFNNGQFGAGSTKQPPAHVFYFVSDMPSSLLSVTPQATLDGTLKFYYSETQFLPVRVTSTYQIVP